MVFAIIVYAALFATGLAWWLRCVLLPLYRDGLQRHRPVSLGSTSLQLSLLCTFFAWVLSYSIGWIVFWSLVPPAALFWWFTKLAGALHYIEFLHPFIWIASGLGCAVFLAVAKFGGRFAWLSPSAATITFIASFLTLADRTAQSAMLQEAKEIGATCLETRSLLFSLRNDHRPHAIMLADGKFYGWSYRNQAYYEMWPGFSPKTYRCPKSSIYFAP